MHDKRKTIQNIQIMRGLAALAVVIAHASAQFPAAGVIPRIDATQAGVDVFFVISGFIMVYVTESRRQTSAQFLLNRIVRIVPNYWFYTLLTAALALAAPTVFRETTFNLPHLILSLLFVAHPNPAIPGSASPLLRPGWTLNYEMFFYLIFSLSLFGWKRRVHIAAGIIAGLALIGLLFPLKSVVYGVYTNGIMLEFVFGMILATLYLRGLPKVPAIVPILLALGGILTTVATSWSAEHVTMNRSLCFGIPAFAIVTASLLIEEVGQGFVGRLLTRLGNASYTIYLSHAFVLAACRVVAARLHIEPHSLSAEIGFVVVAAIVASLSGYFAYGLIEVRLTRWSRLLLIEPRDERPEQTIAGKQGEMA